MVTVAHVSPARLPAPYPQKQIPSDPAAAGTRTGATLLAALPYAGQLGKAHMGESMDTAVGRDRFWEMFKGRAVMVSKLPAGPSRALANVASELAGRDGASLRT